MNAIIFFNQAKICTKLGPGVSSQALQDMMISFNWKFIGGIILIPNISKPKLIYILFSFRDFLKLQYQSTVLHNVSNLLKVHCKETTLHCTD